MPTPPSGANELTAQILLEIPRRFPGVRCWRQNVGGAYPIQSIQAVKRALAAGDLALARTAMDRARPRTYGVPGLPDIAGILPDGRWLAIEIKWGRDRLSEEQETCRRIFTERGAVYIVARDLAGCISDIESSLSALLRQS